MVNDQCCDVTLTVYVRMCRQGQPDQDKIPGTFSAGHCTARCGNYSDDYAEGGGIR